MRPLGPRAYRAAAALLTAALAGLWSTGATAQSLGGNLTAGSHPTVSPDQPVTFTSDNVEYDRERALVTATGHVEAWQNDRVIRADTVTFDRNTNVVAASGHVVLVEPDGQVVFSDYAELGEGMRDGVLRGMRAQLAENGRLAANGARRSEGKINELSKVVYTTCNLCKQDPTRPPLWQIRALSAVQDLENKRIEYTDATLQMAGVPVGYFPYFSHPDPSVKRATGLLIPSAGYSSHIGGFLEVPYYFVLDDQSDLLVSPLLSTKAGPGIGLGYRRRFNDGELRVNLDGAYVTGNLNGDHGFQGLIDANGKFNLDDTWRGGFDLQRASSANYIRDFKLGHDFGTNTPTVLSSQAYLEGFGDGAYARLDSKFYQGLSSTIVASKLPVVLPRFEYSYFGQTDSLGGRLSIDTQNFNVIRSDGTNTRRAALTTNWERPFNGQLGDLWKLTLHGDAAGYNASQFNQQPNYASATGADVARAIPQAALEVRWPFMRDGGAWGQQLIEPILQGIAAPNTGHSQFQKYPNEDSLDLEFTDQNLFAFNRFPGLDRLEGGVRANAGLHSAWYLGGTAFDGLVGQSYRTSTNPGFTAQSGLNGTVSDIVARGTFAPTRWLDLTYRTRLDKNNLTARMSDAVASAGTDAFRVHGGFIYTRYNPYDYYDQAPPPPSGSNFYFPREELTVGANVRYGVYHASFDTRQDIQTSKPVSIGARAGYEDECFIFDVVLYRRYTNINGDHGASTVLFQFTFKTIGQFGYKAL